VTQRAAHPLGHVTVDCCLGPDGEAPSARPAKKDKPFWSSSGVAAGTTKKALPSLL
jgi:hypothetical protein